MGSRNLLGHCVTPAPSHPALPLLQPDRQKHCTNFLHEAKMLSRLNHPNILRYYGLVYEAEADTVPLGICTEYVQGGSLASFLRWVQGGHTQGLAGYVWKHGAALHVWTVPPVYMQHG
jgi:serine/threonine protein kinase